jgi:mRNA interferase RelE/StbE
MAKYTVTISRTAQKQLDKMDDNKAEPIIRAIQLLGGNPRPNGFKKLTGRPGYRIRKGNYRIIYDIHDTVLIVEVINIGDRKDIYD